MQNRSSAREPLLLLGVSALVLVWSGIDPHERGTWWLEVAPVLIGAPLLVATYQRFPLSRLLYWLLFVHAVILMVGGHYTYARVPLGFWVQEWFELSRNHYDRLGHFAQGFVPAILTREILLRCSPLGSAQQAPQHKGWLFFLVVCTCLAFSAFYELLEWWAALWGGDSAESFLGTQGDPWDTQADMFFALLGACTALLLLARRHDRSMRRVAHRPG